MRNNNTFGTKYPTGSIGRYRTEDLNVIANNSTRNINDVYSTGDIKNKAENDKAREKG